MNRKSLLVILLSAIGFGSMKSNPLPYREKYADALRYFSEADQDSLKYKATLFLIDNMDGHFSPEGDAIDEYVYQISTMKKYNGTHELRTEWNKAWKKGPVVFAPDSAVIGNSFVIDNVNDAFEAWNKSVWKNDVDFSHFCKYVLPYRVNDEHISPGWREYLRKEYGPLVEGISDIRQAFAIIKDTVFKAVVLSNDYCPYTLDPIACNKAGRAECGQRCVLLVAVLRSLGIPAVIDCTPMWADYSNKGHAWVAMVESNGDTYTVSEHDVTARLHNPIDASQFSPKYQITTEDACPYTVKTNKTPVKVYRMCYEHCNEADESLSGLLASPFIMDVSRKYGLDTELKVKAASGQMVFLCSYLSGVDWMPVAKAMSVSGEACFSDVGKESVCVFARMNGKRREFMSCPFLVGEGGVKKVFTPSVTETQTIRIDRKYPLCSYTTDTWGGMKDGIFEGANRSDFRDADTIGMIKTMPWGMTVLKVESQKPYRFLRYHAPINNRSSMAELQFYAIGKDGSQCLLKGTCFAQGVDEKNVHQVFDGILSTSCKGVQVGYYIGLDLGEGNADIVRKIAFSPSTDLNFVEKNHLYELLYFDTEWHLLGRTYSGNTCLEFQNVPKGALLLLKDKSGGMEERIFEYVDDKQIWH